MSRSSRSPCCAQSGLNTADAVTGVSVLQWPKWYPGLKKSLFFCFQTFFLRLGKAAREKKMETDFAPLLQGWPFRPCLKKDLVLLRFLSPHICRPHLRSSGYRGGSELRAGSRRDTKVRGSSKQATPSNPLIAAITGLEGVRNFEPRLLMAVHITTRIFEVRSSEHF